MTKADLEQITKAIASSKDNKGSDQAKYIDWLFKALIAILVWLGTEMKGDVNVLKENVSKMATERVYSERDMEEFKSFISKPRFTREEYDILTTPIINNINKNSLELKMLGQDKNDMDKRLMDLEYRVGTPNKR